MKRITTRKGKLYADAYNMMLLTLPGSVITFQGEEIAMEDIELTFEETRDQRGQAFGHVSFPILYIIITLQGCYLVNS